MLGKEVLLASLNPRLRQLRYRMHGDGLAARMLRGGIGSFFLKLASMLLTFVLAILLSRALGPEDFGLYSYVFALISLLAIPAEFGLPTLLVRETARARINSDWAALKGVWRWSTGVTGVISLLILSVSVLSAALFAGHFAPHQLATFAWALLLLPLIALGKLSGAALRGLHCVLAAPLPENLLRHALLIVLVMILWGASQAAPSAVQAMGLHALSAAIALAVGMLLLWHARPPEIRRSLVPRYAHRHWIMSTLPLAFTAGMHLINSHTDVLMLGLFSSVSDVGIYRVAVQAASLVLFGLQVVNMVVVPYFASLHARGDYARLRRVVTVSSRAILAVAIPIVLILSVFGEPILSLVFGDAYVEGASALTILAFGQLINAAVGSVGFLLNMTGHENVVARAVALSAVANIGLNLLLIPNFGMNGAAAATSVSLIIWNVMLWHAARQRLGIDSTALSR